MNDKNVTLIMATLLLSRAFFLTENRICEFFTFAASICKNNSLDRTGYLEYGKIKIRCGTTNNTIERPEYTPRSLTWNQAVYDYFQKECAFQSPFSGSMFNFRRIFPDDVVLFRDQNLLGVIYFAPLTSFGHSKWAVHLQIKR